MSSDLRQWPVPAIRSLEPKARGNAGRAREWRAVCGFGFFPGGKRNEGLMRGLGGDAALDLLARDPEVPPPGLASGPSGAFAPNAACLAGLPSSVHATAAGMIKTPGRTINVTIIG